MVSGRRLTSLARSGRRRQTSIRIFRSQLQKPVDTPYGPYADGFSLEQHKFGPFGPIRAKVQELAAASRTMKAGEPDNGSDERARQLAPQLIASRMSALHGAGDFPLSMHSTSGSAASG